jgi:hypothetical protein
MIVEQCQSGGAAVVSLAELTGKLDTTKIRVTDGDIPAGDWIFNGHGIVLVPKDAKDAKPDAAKKDPATEDEKIVIELDHKVRVTPRKAEEFGPLRQLASDMTPLAGTIGGVMLLGNFIGPMGAMAGFAAGKTMGRNIATFTCELEDGRKFNAMCDYKIFRRLQGIAKE